MTTVFSHIIQKRFSNVSEDVATDALARVLPLRACQIPRVCGLTKKPAPETPRTRLGPFATTTQRRMHG